MDLRSLATCRTRYVRTGRCTSSDPANDRLALACLAAEGGWSLIELLVAMVATVFVTVGIFSALEQATRVDARDTEWALSLQQERTGLQRMASELGQAFSIQGATANSIDFTVTEGGTSEQVYYECDVAQTGTSYRECVRLQAAVGASLPALSTGAPIVQNLVNGTTSDPVFSFYNGSESAQDMISPNFVQLKIEVAAAGYTNSIQSYAGLQHTTVLEDGVNLRNLSLGA